MSSPAKSDSVSLANRSSSTQNDNATLSSSSMESPSTASFWGPNGYKLVGDRIIELSLIYEEILKMAINRAALEKKVFHFFLHLRILTCINYVTD